MIEIKPEELAKVDYTLKHCVDNDGKTYVVFWLYRPELGKLVTAMMTKIEPDGEHFTIAADVAQQVLVQQITEEVGTWDIRFTIMDPDEAREYSERAGLSSIKEQIWEGETNVTRH